MEEQRVSMEIGDKVYPLYPERVNIAMWLELIASVNSGNTNIAGEKMLRMVLLVMPGAGELPLNYISVLIPRVMEKVAEVFNMGDMDTEIQEILNRSNQS